jgi:hypothetical protein
MSAEINKEAITIQDCLDNFEKKNRRAILNDGQVVDFEKEGEWADDNHATVEEPIRMAPA